MSGTGPRFTWDNTSNFILLFSLLSDTKIGSGGWDAASAKLAEKGFLSSDGNPIKASAISQHYTKLRAQIMKLAVESTSTSTGGSHPPLTATEGTPATPKRTRAGRPKQTDEQKAAAKAVRDAKKASGATPTKRGGRGRLRITKGSPYVGQEEDSDEPMANRRGGDGGGENYAAGTPSKKRRMSIIVKKVEKTRIDNATESAGSGEMDISDSQ